MLEQYYRINQATGIAVNIQADGTALFNVCSVIAENKTLNIVKKAPGLLSINEVSKHLPAKTKIALNISGRGVLYKQIGRTEEIDQASFNKVLPNAQFNDFYIQNFVSGEHSFVAVIRKTDADRWITQLTEAGYQVLCLSLGPFTVDNILTQLNFYGAEIQFDGHDIRFDEHKNWLSYQVNSAKHAAFTIKVDNEAMDERLIIPYAAAFQLILSAKLNLIQASAEPLDELLSKTLSQLKLKTQGFVVLTIFFLLLLINLIILSSLNNANARLTDQVSRSAQSSTDIQQLQQQVKQKEALLQLLGWDGAINKSALLDQVALLLPTEVKWLSSEINPLDLATSRTEKAPVFFNRRIRITGTSEKIIPVNEWIARIKTAKWVKQVEMDSYAFNSELNTGQFTVIIDY